MTRKEWLARQPKVHVGSGRPGLTVPDYWTVHLFDGAVVRAVNRRTYRQLIVVARPDDQFELPAVIPQVVSDSSGCPEGTRGVCLHPVPAEGWDKNVSAKDGDALWIQDARARAPMIARWTGEGFRFEEPITKEEALP